MTEPSSMLKETDMHVFGSSAIILELGLSSRCLVAERNLEGAVLLCWLPAPTPPTECVRDVLWAPSCNIATLVPSRSRKGDDILIGAPRVKDALGRKKVVSPMKTQDPDST